MEGLYTLASHLQRNMRLVNKGALAQTICAEIQYKVLFFHICYQDGNFEKFTPFSLRPRASPPASNFSLIDLHGFFSANKVRT